MVLPFLQLLERDRECVVHEVLPQVAKDLVPEYVGAILEVRLRNIAIAVDTDIKRVLFGEFFCLFSAWVTLTLLYDGKVCSLA